MYELGGGGGERGRIAKEKETDDTQEKLHIVDFVVVLLY